jgi:hypothetical protein
MVRFVSSFEFITVLYAVIVGLAIAHLLTGLGRAIHHRASAPLWWVHMSWTIAIFSYITLNWWTLFYLSEETTWTYLSFLYLLMHAVMMFLLAVLHYPPEPEGSPDYRVIFATNRPWLLGTFSASFVIDIGATALQGNLWNPWFYLPVVVHLALLMGVGAVYSGIRYQQFLAVYVPAFILGWGVVVRGILAA